MLRVLVLKENIIMKAIHTIIAGIFVVIQQSYYNIFLGMIEKRLIILYSCFSAVI